MKVLIFGSRKWNGRFVVYDLLDSLYTEVYTDDLYPLIVVEGGAAGADRYAREWCHKMAGDDHGVVWDPHPAKWNEHHPAWCDGDCAGSRKQRTYCSVAGFRRNQEMVDTNPDRAFGFGDTNGTMDTFARATAAGIYTVRQWYEGPMLLREEVNKPAVGSTS